MAQEIIDFLRGQFNLVVYFITLCISIFYYRTYFDTGLKYFPMIIAYTFFNELLGYFIRYSDEFAFFPEEASANDLIYNIYAVVFFGFFYLFYLKQVKLESSKRNIKFLITVVVISYLINAFYKNPIKLSLFHAHALSAIGLVFIVIIYFRDKKNIWSWKIEQKNLVFWVSLGLLIFYSIFPFIYLIGFLKSTSWMWDAYHLRTVLRIILLIMYSLFCIGFIKSSRRAFR